MITMQKTSAKVICFIFLVALISLPFSIGFAGISLPQIPLPPIKLADIQLPDIQLPDIQLPDIQLPDIQLPDIEISGGIGDVSTQDQVADEAALLSAALPENGEMHYFITSEDGAIQIETEPVAKNSAIEITVPSGDDYYLVTLADPVTFQKQIVIFVYPGETVMVEIPSGEYWLYYTYGPQWYGFEDKFGPAASRSRTEVSDVFEDGYYWSYTLYAVSDGNVSTEAVDPAEYPD